MAQKAILFDTTKCMACRACQVACKQWNELEADKTANFGSYENPASLTANNWVKIRFNEVGRDGSLQWLFTRQSCMHCTDAACVTVCPTDALYHHPDGFVAYDESKCSGCGYCAEYCPFGVPQSKGNNLIGIRKMEKCRFCVDRTSNGLDPACVKTCPTSALRFGDRDDLVVTGKQRVREVRTAYPASYLYGEKELGGLHVLYVLTNEPEAHGLPAAPSVPVSAVVWKNIFQPVAYGLIGLTALGLGLNYLVARASVNAEREAGVRWMCPTCGYILQGDRPPERCPVSGDPARKFVKMEE